MDGEEFYTKKHQKDYCHLLFKDFKMFILLKLPVELITQQLFLKLEFYLLGVEEDHIIKDNWVMAQKMTLVHQNHWNFLNQIESLIFVVVIIIC